MEIIVDAYGPEEQVMGWHSYLEEWLEVPFTARCIAARPISPLKKGDEVEVVEMGPIEECGREMFVFIRWDHKGKLAVPLMQLKPVAASEETCTAVADWHYWTARGYEFG